MGDHRHAVKVGAVVARGLETKPAELSRDVPGGQLAASGCRGAALEQIVGEELQA